MCTIDGEHEWYVVVNVWPLNCNLLREVCVTTSTEQAAYVTVAEWRQGAVEGVARVLTYFTLVTEKMQDYSSFSVHVVSHTYNEQKDLFKNVQKIKKASE